MFRPQTTRLRLRPSSLDPPVQNRDQDWDPPTCIVTVPGPSIPQEVFESRTLCPVSTLGPGFWLSRVVVDLGSSTPRCVITESLPSCTVTGSGTLRSRRRRFWALTVLRSRRTPGVPPLVTSLLRYGTPPSLETSNLRPLEQVKVPRQRQVGPPTPPCRGGAKTKDPLTRWSRRVGVFRVGVCPEALPRSRGPRPPARTGRAVQYKIN